jgi:hypothetical protein
MSNKRFRVFEVLENPDDIEYFYADTLKEVTRKIQEIVSAKVWKHRDENGEDADLSKLADVHIKIEVWDRDRNEYVKYLTDEETKKFVEEGLLAPDDDTNRHVH